MHHAFQEQAFSSGPLNTDEHQSVQLVISHMRSASPKVTMGRGESIWGWEWREEGERAVRLSDSEKEKGKHS